MRRMLVWMVMLALLLGGVWLGGESLMARELRRYAAEDPMTELARVDEMRQPGRIGVRADQARLATPMGVFALPSADLWLSPLRPTVLRLDLPPTAMLERGGQTWALGLTDAEASLRMQPLSGLDIAAMAIQSGPVTLRDQPFAESIDLRADLAPDLAADQGEGTGYDLDLTLAQLSPDAFSNALPIPGSLDLHAQGRIWLDRPASPAAMTPQTMPLPTGLRLTDARIRLGRVEARVIGDVRADAQGRAQGAMAIYTQDARPLLQAAADGGLIPARALALAGTMIDSIARLPLPDGSMAFPAPEPGELRLPVVMRDGRISLGPVPLGPAPMFPRR